MVGNKLFCHHHIYFSLRVLLILHKIQLFDFHSEKNLVNFNDVRARIQKLEIETGTVWYADTNVTLKEVDWREAESYSAIFINRATGCGIFQNSNKTYLGEKCLREKLPLPEQLIYGPMGKNGFWGLESVDGAADQDEFFSLVKSYLIKSSLVDGIDIKYSIEKGSIWRFVEIFEWKTDLFVCFETSNQTLVTLRMKVHPENSTAYGTFISSFFVDSTPDATVYFLPSYSEPTMYYSLGENNISFNALNLNDIIAESEAGINSCKDGGKFPSNFLKLETYIANLSRESWLDEENCTEGIPLFYVNESRSMPCFQLEPDFISESPDVFTVGYEMNARILAYIVKNDVEQTNIDIRCDLSKCGSECSNETTNFDREGPIFTYWNVDQFSLQRYPDNGLRYNFKMLDCQYYETCSLCTLYGGFNCRWKSSKCVSNSQSKESDSCYEDISASSVGIGDNYFEITINLPHQLRPEYFERASISLDEKNFSDVQYADGTYQVDVPQMEVTEALIRIQRGRYEMISYFTISLESDEESFIPKEFRRLILILSIILAVVAIIVYCGIGEDHGKEEKKDQGGSGKGKKEDEAQIGNKAEKMAEREDDVEEGSVPSSHETTHKSHESTTSIE